MALKLSAIKPTFSTNVEVFTANDKCGHDKSVFVAQFSRSDLDEYERLTEMKGVDVLREKLVGWDQFLDDDGAPVPFNDETKEALLAIPEAVAAMVLSFWESFNKQKVKNSKR